MSENIQIQSKESIAVNTVPRETNLEVYRIISMLLIVAHHYIVNTGIAITGGPIFADPLSVKSLFLLVFGAWGKTGINCFIMITGYFMCKSRITARKFFKLLLEWLFYRYVIYAVFWITGYSPFSLKALLEGLVFIKEIDVNFTVCFLLFFLFIPFLNILVNNMNEKQHVRLIVLLSFIYVLFGTFHRVTINYVVWFSVIYIFASYIRIYPKKIFENTRLWGLLTLLCSLLIVSSVIAGTLMRVYFEKSMSFYFVQDSNTFLAVATGVCSFLFFKNLKIRHSRFINSVAASTFGVLCIHAHSGLMGQWLWYDVLDVVNMYSSQYAILYAVFSVIGIFVVCNLIDYLRVAVIEKPFFNLWDKMWPAFQTRFNRFESGVLEKYNIKDDNQL